MSRSLLVAAALAAAATACRPAPPATPADVEARLARIEERLDRLTGVQPGSDEPITADVRLLRIEERLDRVVAFLKQAVPPTLDDSKVYAIPVDPLDPVIGPADAAVTLVEAYEYLCPYCAQVEPTLAALHKRFPRELRVVSKYYVIHGEPAMPSGKAACAAARQGKFPALHDAMWKAIWPPSGRPDRDQASAEAVSRMAKAAGLDMLRFQADVAGPCGEWLTDSARTLQQFGAGGTPTFWINGRPVESGADLEQAVENELARVKRSGVAPGRYYQDEVLGKGERAAVMVSPFD